MFFSPNEAAIVNGTRVIGEEIKTSDVENYLRAISNGSKVVAMLLRVLSSVYVFLSALPFLFLILNGVFPTRDLFIMEGSFENAALALLQAFCFAMPMWVLSDVCGETARGLSPFSANQVRRMRTVSAVLLLLAVIDYLLVPGLLVFSPQEGVMLGGYVHTAELKINIAAIVASLALFLLSFVFKYGVMLQSVSDDVI